MNTTNREECTFYAHGVCVSFIMERFRPDDTKCLPACASYQFHMENLHVSCIIAGINILKIFKYLKVNEDHQKELRSQLALNDEISLHSAIIRLSENANIILEETSTYPSSSFLSDTGGALGLFLGWSILNILRLFGRIYSLMIRITQRLDTHFR